MLTQKQRSLPMDRAWQFLLVSKRCRTPAKFSFVSVDAEQGVRRPAFNHEWLAKALNGHGVEAHANALPFT